MEIVYCKTFLRLLVKITKILKNKNSVKLDETNKKGNQNENESKQIDNTIIFGIVILFLSIFIFFIKKKVYESKLS